MQMLKRKRRMLQLQSLEHKPRKVQLLNNTGRKDLFIVTFLMILCPTAFGFMKDYSWTTLLPTLPPKQMSIGIQRDNDASSTLRLPMSLKNSLIASNNAYFKIQSLRRMQQHNDDDYGYDDDDDDDEDDDEPPSVDPSKFVPPTLSYGLNKGRSPPSQRKAMGTSGSSTASVHVCTNCGSEFVKWMGRCPTCKEWNTLQEFAVKRERSSSSSNNINPYNRPVFQNQQQQRSRSWLDFDNAASSPMSSYMDPYSDNRPIRLTDITKDLSKSDGTDDKKGSGYKRSNSNQRISIPQDEELDNVLGGGIMMGSLTLLGGDPGIGKSTLLLQTAASVASLASPTPQIGMGMGGISPGSGDNTAQHHGHGQLGPVWYVSGEETAEQIAIRASRLGIDQPELWLLSETHADALAEQVVNTIQVAQAASVRNQTTEEFLLTPKPPSLLIIDSIQTMLCDAGGSSAAGGITQMRECVALFLRLSKSTRIPIILVGHVTKSGGVAGPRTVEHMVDCVLYLEGTNDSSGFNLRMLRASKNRFGSCDEVGVYEMTSGHLLPVSDPSSLLMAQRMITQDADGCSVTLTLEGMRVMTVEVQALVTATSSYNGFGRRTVNGIQQSRLLLLLGVLQKRCGIFLSKHDVFVNVVGQMRLDRGEGSASDLAVSIALVSSLTSIQVRSDTAFVGEVGLLGELRPVSTIQKRLQEAKRMGFQRVITPRDKTAGRGRSTKMFPKKSSSSYYRDIGIEWIQCDTLLEAINAGLESPLPKKRSSQTRGKRSNNKSDIDFEILDNEDDEYDGIIPPPKNKNSRPLSNAKPAPGKLGKLGLKIIDTTTNGDVDSSNIFPIGPQSWDNNNTQSAAPGSIEELGLDEDNDDLDRANGIQ